MIITAAAQQDYHLFMPSLPNDELSRPVWLSRSSIFPGMCMHCRMILFLPFPIFTLSTIRILIK